MKRWIPMIFLVLFEGLADIFAKKRSESQVLWIALGALMFYLVCNAFWLFALKHGVGLGRGSIIFSVLSAILALSIGYFLFGERFSSLQMIGIALGLIAIVLVNL